MRVSHGGKCREMKNNEGDLMDTEEPSHLQGGLEEADTLIAFHASSVSSGDILVRSPDTDVLVILVGLAGRYETITIILDYGSGNHRRYIHVSNLAANPDEKQHRLTEALVGFIL